MGQAHKATEGHEIECFLGCYVAYCVCKSFFICFIVCMFVFVLLLNRIMWLVNTNKHITSIQTIIILNNITSNNVFVLSYVSLFYCGLQELGRISAHVAKARRRTGGEIHTEPQSILLLSLLLLS